ncbi:MAG: anion permease [Candidatus Omnitrophica bacterium]|nr:anion permease [Candidatus Omnitrophota bacterium]
MTIILLIIAAGIFMGWNIGANDAANCVGADIGSRRITLKEGIIITCVFSFLGAILLGSKVIKTVGKGVVPLDKLNPEVSMLVALAACMGAGLWVLLATYRKIPVSTSHSIVGAVAGAGLAIFAPIYWSKIGEIFLSWILTPFGSGLLAFLIYPFIRRVYFNLVPRRFERQVSHWLLILSSIYLAFTWGANDVANVTGIMVGSGIFSTFWAAVIGGGAIVLGVTTWGYKVIETVGFRITRMSPVMTFVAEVATALNVQIYTHLGIPVSTSHSMVGAIIGVGLARGIKALNRKIIRDMVIAWSLTPFTSGLISFIIMKIIWWVR